MAKSFISTCGRLTAVALLAVSAAGMAKGELKLTNAAFQEIEVEAPNGDIQTRRVPVAKVFPGSEVLYVVTYENMGEKPASKVTITNPVPSVMEYVGQSASTQQADVTFSVDGGVSYASLDALTVTGEDGNRRPATSLDVTNVRWQLIAPILPGNAGSVEYRARLK